MRLPAAASVAQCGIEPPARRAQQALACGWESPAPAASARCCSAAATSSGAALSAEAVAQPLRRAGQREAPAHGVSAPHPLERVIAALLGPAPSCDCYRACGRCESADPVAARRAVLACRLRVPVDFPASRRPPPTPHRSTTWETRHDGRRRGLRGGPPGRSRGAPGAGARTRRQRHRQRPRRRREPQQPGGGPPRPGRHRRRDRAAAGSAGDPRACRSAPTIPTSRRRSTVWPGSMPRATTTPPPSRCSIRALDHPRAGARRRRSLHRRRASTTSPCSTPPSGATPTPSRSTSAPSPSSSSASDTAELATTLENYAALLARHGTARRRRRRWSSARGDCVRRTVAKKRDR